MCLPYYESILTFDFLLMPIEEEKEKSVAHSQHKDTQQGIHIPIGNKKIANIDEQLQHRVKYRHTKVRHVQFVGNSLVEMLAMRLKNILTCQKTFGDGEQSVSKKHDNECQNAHCRAAIQLPLDIKHE